jgi:hypothetical protein
MKVKSFNRPCVVTNILNANKLFQVIPSKLHTFLVQSIWPRSDFGIKVDYEHISGFIVYKCRYPGNTIFCSKTNS